MLVNLNMAVYEDFMTMIGLNTKLVNKRSNELFMKRDKRDQGYLIVQGYGFNFYLVLSFEEVFKLEVIS